MDIRKWPGGSGPYSIGYLVFIGVRLKRALAISSGAEGISGKVLTESSAQPIGFLQ